jgi:hypothetical protein
MGEKFRTLAIYALLVVVLGLAFGVGLFGNGGFSSGPGYSSISNELICPTPCLATPIAELPT